MSKVSLIKCTSYEQDQLSDSIKKAINLIGGLDSILKRDAKVFIKLNLVGPFDKDKGITTHPEFVKAVIKEVKKFTNNITVGDNPAVRDQIHTLKKCGIYNILVEENVKILDQSKIITIHNSNSKIYPDFDVTEEMMTCDLLINLPKLKTHSLAYMTVCEKNFFGTIYGLNKSAWHVKANNPLEFGSAMNDLYGAILETLSKNNSKILNICDGILGLEGEGPSTGGKPKYANAILCSLDAVSLDAVACKLVNLDNNKIFITNIAAERGYGENDLNKIEIIGNQLSDFNINFEAPKDSMGNVALRILKFKFIRNLVLEHPKINPNKCIKCGECVKICPPKTMTIEKGKYPKLQKIKCIRCWCCQEVCPQNAIEKSKRPLIGRILIK